MFDIDAVRNNTPVWLDIFFNMYRSNDSDVYSTSLPLKLSFQFYFFFVLQEKGRLLYAYYNSIPCLQL